MGKGLLGFRGHFVRCELTYFMAHSSLPLMGSKLAFPLAPIFVRIVLLTIHRYICSEYHSIQVREKSG